MSVKENCPYQRVEYLESDGYSNCMTDLEYIPQRRITDIYIGLMILGYKEGSYNILLGTFPNNPNQELSTWNIQRYGASDNTISVRCGGRYGSGTSIYCPKDIKHDIIMRRDFNFIVDGQETLCNQSANYDAIDTFKLFIGNSTMQRLYYLKIVNGDDVVLDLVPVRVGDEGFMYDRVSGKLFGNAGTGRFILGPDINS